MYFRNISLFKMEGPAPSNNETILDIKVSDVAVLLDKNPYQSKEDTINLIFSGKKREYLHLSQAKKVYESDENIKQIIDNNLDAAAVQSTLMPTASLIEVKEQINIANRVSGIVDETKIGELFTSATGIKIYPIKNKAATILTYRGFNAVLKGRSDGIGYAAGGEKVLIEIKRRRRAFSQNDYDIIQIYLYLYLYNMNRIFLVEYLDGIINYSIFTRDDKKINDYLDQLRAVLIHHVDSISL